MAKIIPRSYRHVKQRQKIAQFTLSFMVDSFSWDNFNLSSITIHQAKLIHLSSKAGIHIYVIGLQCPKSGKFWHLTTKLQHEWLSYRVNWYAITISKSNWLIIEYWSWMEHSRTQWTMLSPFKAYYNPPKTSASFWMAFFSPLYWIIYL